MEKTRFFCFRHNGFSHTNDCIYLIYVILNNLNDTVSECTPAFFENFPKEIHRIANFGSENKRKVF